VRVVHRRGGDPRRPAGLHGLPVRACAV